MEERKLRRRVNLSTSVKGVITWDLTVDGDVSEEEILAMADSLCRKLQEKYPLQIEVKQ